MVECPRAQTDEFMLQMLNAIMHAPLTFFELTPTGRYVSVAVAIKGISIMNAHFSILNLFSRDTYVVDMILARVCALFIGVG